MLIVDMAFCLLRSKDLKNFWITRNFKINKFVKCKYDIVFTLQLLRAVGVLFSPMVSGWAGRRTSWWAGGRPEKVCPGCISETVRCRKLILCRDIGWGCRCAASWCDLDLAFDLAVVTLSLKILSRLYLRNRKV